MHSVISAVHCSFVAIFGSFKQNLLILYCSPRMAPTHHPTDRPSLPANLDTFRYPHKCRFCLKPVRTKRAMDTHIRIHTGLGKACPICQKSFRDGSALKSHLWTHNTDRVQCKFCGITLNSPNSLNVHVHTKHRNQRTHSSAQAHNWNRTTASSIQYDVHSLSFHLECMVC